MGCWNGTCSISQLPILAGTKVKTILLLQSEFAHGIGGSGTCYITGYFRPWFFPVTAEYNDYGSIENIEMDWNAQYMLETFQKWLKDGEVKILENDECEINSSDIEQFDKLEDVFDCVERGALVFKNTGKTFDHESQKWVPAKGYLKIAMNMVLIPVWESLLEESVRFNNLPENNYYKKFGDDQKESAREAVNKARTKFNGHKEMDELEGCIYDIKVDRYLGDIIEEHYAFKHYKPTLYDPNTVTVEEFFKRVDEIRSITSSMTYLRKLFFPQTGQGSQSEELSFNKALINGMLKHIAERDKEMEEWQKEEEEWQKQKAKKTKKGKKK